jgi:hypothetical protein
LRPYQLGLFERDEGELIFGASKLEAQAVVLSCGLSKRWGGDNASEARRPSSSATAPATVEEQRNEEAQTPTHPQENKKRKKTEKQNEKTEATGRQRGGSGATQREKKSTDLFRDPEHL